jgi:hypothetical protein
MAPVKRSVAFNYVLIGREVLLFFNRVMGTGWLWERVPPDDNVSLSKNRVQEALELLDYILIFYGSLMFRRSTRTD